MYACALFVSVYVDSIAALWKRGTLAV